MLNSKEQEFITTAVNNNVAKKMKYIGKEEVYTRGNLGEMIEYGYLWDSNIYVFDCSFGWMFFDNAEYNKDFVLA